MYTKEFYLLFFCAFTFFKLSAQSSHDSYLKNRYYPHRTKIEISENSIFHEYRNDFNFDDPSSTITFNSRISIKRYLVLNNPDRITSIKLEVFDSTRSFPELLYFKNIKHLSYGSHKSKVIPKEIFELKKLETLHIWGPDIEDIPDNISKLKTLRHLNIICSNLKQISNKIYSLKNLESLNINSYNYQIPNKIRRLKSLVRLTINVKEVSKELDKLKKLKFLDISKTDNIPFESIFSLNELKELKIDIHTEDEIKGISKLTSLDRLEIRCPEIYDEVYQIYNLKYLDINCNSSFISEKMLDLKKLKFLDISANNLTTEPRFLLEHESLNCLYITGKGLNSYKMKDILSDITCICYSGY